MIEDLPFLIDPIIICGAGFGGWWKNQIVRIRLIYGFSFVDSPPCILRICTCRIT